MTSMENLSRADSLAYRDAVIAREPARLAQLADWVVTTGGPLDELDGTLDSLTALWPWLIDFVEADCPGIPLGAATQRGLMFTDPGDFTHGHRRWYAAETLGHYVLLVAKRIDPTAHWQSWTWKPTAYLHYQETGILLDYRATPVTPMKDPGETLRLQALSSFCAFSMWPPLVSTYSAGNPATTAG